MTNGVIPSGARSAQSRDPYLPEAWPDRVLDSLSPAALAWLHRGAVFGHVAAVVVWFGAVAYYLLILRPALRRSGVDRKAQYAILAEIRARLKRVVGVAVAVLVLTGFTLARDGHRCHLERSAQRAVGGSVPAGGVA